MAYEWRISDWSSDVCSSDLFAHGARHARRQPQRGVAHVRRLFTEDRAEQLFFRRHRAFALRRDLAAQDIARLHLCADIDDARLVQVPERFLAHVRDRSEEHTSELQSLMRISYAVFCLKKKNTDNNEKEKTKHE